MPDFSNLSLQWPWALLLLVVPASVLLWARPRPIRGLARKSTRQMSGPGGLPIAGGLPSSGSLPIVLMALGLSLLALAVARPRAPIWQPAAIDRLMIAIDSSGSMRADDVSPSRIEVARQTARRLIDAMPASAQVGLVSLAANAAVVQASTRDREALRSALDRLSLQPGSALGSGIAVGLAELLPEAKIDVEALVGGVSRRNAVRKAPFEQPESPIDTGSRKDAMLVVLADGDSNFGPDPRKMAEIAQLWGVRIYTVGIGTPQGVVLRSEGVSARVRLEEKTLREIANISGGEYFAINETESLAKIYGSLSGRMGLRKRQEAEITAWVAVLGMLLVALSAIVSTARSGRVFSA